MEGILPCQSSQGDGDRQRKISPKAPAAGGTTALAMSSLTVYAGGGEVYDIEWEEDLPVVASASSLEIPAKSAILIEQTTGKILYEMNADEKMPPASITKIMTMLLVMEALDAGQIHLEDMSLPRLTHALWGEHKSGWSPMNRCRSMIC